MKIIKSLLNKKKRGQTITMLTAYDHPLASIIDQAGIDVVLVGDSLANVVLGLNSTKEVGMAEMLHHTGAVRRAVKNAFVIGDMPFSAYQRGGNAVVNAKRFMKIGCDAVKLEWFDGCLKVTEKIVKAGIPVMGHVGLTPQTVDKLGGYKVQGRDPVSARRIIEQAVALESHGCFAVVLECVPEKVAAEITKTLKIPTIGIGAGVKCDGQVLVTYDMLGMFSRFHPKFAKQYVNLTGIIKKAVGQYKAEVKSRRFPGRKHSFK